MVVIIVSIVIIAIKGVIFQNSSTFFLFVMVVIIVSVVIIVTERVIFQKKSAIFFCDGCEHCDYCHKRGPFSEYLYNFFYL